jgi:hypothetical protein
MRLSFKFIGILLREQCPLSGSVPKQDCLVRLEKSGADQIVVSDPSVVRTRGATRVPSSSIARSIFACGNAATLI